MLPLSLDLPTFQVLSRELDSSASAFFRIPLTSLYEALARGYGAGSHAALREAFQADGTVRASEFDHSAFVAHLAASIKSANALASANAVGVMADGFRISIAITKWSKQRLRTEAFLDIVYDIVVEVRGTDGNLIQGDLSFLIPTFHTMDGHEPYRVDSCYQFRKADEYVVTRAKRGQGLLKASLIDGRWEGRLYVYADKHQEDDSRCVTAVKAALARAILPVASPRVHCAIYQPDHYQYGAWRLEMTLGAEARSHLGSDSISFSAPTLAHRIIHPGGYRADTDKWKFIDGVFKADLYSNGMEEDVNPTSLDIVRKACLNEVGKLLRASGFRPKALATPKLRATAVRQSEVVPLSTPKQNDLDRFRGPSSM